jgi:hypothetical protein
MVVKLPIQWGTDNVLEWRVMSYSGLSEDTPQNARVVLCGTQRSKSSINFYATTEWNVSQFRETLTVNYMHKINPPTEHCQINPSMIPFKKKKIHNNLNHSKRKIVYEVGNANCENMKYRSQDSNPLCLVHIQHGIWLIQSN